MRNRHTSFRHRPGFTLVELLVVIGIIALLISILLPSLNKARQAAMKAQDLNNIRQVAIGCVTYASEFRGSWPRGDRGRIQANDDLKWVHSTTYDYLLRAVGGSGGQTARDLANGGTKIPADRLRMMSCNTLQDLVDVGDYSGGDVSYYARGPDDNPYADPPGYDEMQMGWIYFGGREPTRIDGTLRQYPSGMPAPSSTPKYVFPRKQGDRPTTTTLLTCYARSTNSFGTMLPHFKRSYASQLLGNSAQPFQLTSQIDGMCMAYTDGSARFVGYDDFGAVTSYSGGWFFYDRLAR